MPIEWNSTVDNPPLPGKEIIAKNPNKPIGYKSSAKQCRIMKFHDDFTSEDIIGIMIDDLNLTIWSYTE